MTDLGVCMVLALAVGWCFGLLLGAGKGRG
jgi:hypothetical protein